MIEINLVSMCPNVDKELGKTSLKLEHSSAETMNSLKSVSEGMLPIRIC